tara:strand:- start:96 stop:365 length:270 start_codon:yes stop_codon:yes gene_type:complete
MVVSSFALLSDDPNKHPDSASTVTTIPLENAEVKLVERCVRVNGHKVMLWVLFLTTAKGKVLQFYPSSQDGSELERNTMVAWERCGSLL